MTPSAMNAANSVKQMKPERGEVAERRPAPVVPDGDGVDSDPRDRDVADGDRDRADERAHADDAIGAPSAARGLHTATNTPPDPMPSSDSPITRYV